MRIFISGGCKNGKSGRAQEIAMRMRPDERPLYYVAAMRPVDDEDDARIARHREERAGMGFTTIECHRDILELTRTCDLGGSFLIDSATALLMNAMFPPGREVDESAPSKLCREFAQLLPCIERLVVVSDFIYSDAAFYDDLTETYRRGLAKIDCALAFLCDVVAEASGGNLVFYKGAEKFRRELEGMI